MTPRLLVRTGPWQGESLTLDDAPLTIGRDPSCSLCLPDATLSRRHAVVTPTSAGWTVRDLGSLNGIRVNGVAVAEQHLAEGDRIEIGGSTFAFCPGDGPPPSPPPPGAEEPGDEPTLRVPPGEAVWQAPAPRSLAGRAARDVGALLAASRSFAAARSVDALASALLDASLAAVQASAGAVHLSNDSGSLVAAAVRLGGDGASPLPGRTALDRVRESREALLWSTGRPGTPDSAPSESFRRSGFGTLAAVPIARGDDCAGVLCVVSAAGGRDLDADDLQLLLGLGLAAAPALALVRHVAWLEGERRRLAPGTADADGIEGRSPAVARLRALLARAAASEATVLLLGESGTGKELAARALHARSGRRDGPFVAVNAAALVETLVESELFGHEKGSFTGALARREGKLEAACGGTLFLDEVGEMPLAVQAKLLRVLETREFERVGGNAPVKANVRLLAATNRDLHAAVKAGRFREDLYYRLCVLTLSLPPLRERREDIPDLASLFLARQAERLGRRFRGFSPSALARLVSYPWPGNVRELANAVERAAVLADDDLIRPEDLPETVLEAAAGSGGEPLAPYHDAVNRAKRDAVSGAMAQAGGSVTEAARLLGLHPNYLHRLLNQLGLRGGAA